MARKTKITAILSDIGEVVAPFDNSKTFREFARISGRSAIEVMDVFMFRGLPLLDQYELGAVSTHDFQKIICDRLGICEDAAPTSEEFFRAYAGVFSLRLDVLAKWCHLRGKGLSLVAVSNICEMRYRELVDMGTFNVFDHEILSFTEGLRKPSEELMVRSLDRAGAKAEEAIFIDDLEPNLGPAKALGIITHHFTTPERLFAFLAEYGL